MRVRLSPIIPLDLEDILEYIAKDSVRYASRTIRRLRAHCTVVAQNPMLYRLRPEIGKEIRLTTLGSDVILFRVDREVVLIERIVHGSRGLLEKR